MSGLIRIPALRQGLRSSMFWAAVFPTLCLAFCGCTDLEEQLRYNDIENPLEATFRPDTVRFADIDSAHRRTYFDPAGTSEEIAQEDYAFRVDELVSAEDAASGDAVRVRSFSASPIRNLTLEVYLSDFAQTLPVAWIDSLPGFTRVEFPLSFIGRRHTLRREDGEFISFEYPYFEASKMELRLRSDDPHFEKLSRIDAGWECRFSNFGWDSTKDSTYNWREMRPLCAREWVVIVTNYAYMMATPEYRHVMEHFREIFGGDLCDNQKTAFTAGKYASEKARFIAPFSFRLGQSGPQVGGLGGGGAWGITDYNFYGHYASFSGWESITHEFMHNMGYSHDSNMTYPQNGVGWTDFIWQLHLWLSRKKDLPYLDRNLLGFHKEENAKYRDCDVRKEFQSDESLEKLIQEWYGKSELVKYFEENPVREL